MNDKYGKYSQVVDFFRRLNIMNVGASPKLTKSAKESICLPNSDCAFNNRAVNPSKKSKIIEIIIKKEAMYKCSELVKATRIALVPHKIFNEVIVFGIIILFNFFIFDV